MELTAERRKEHEEGVGATIFHSLIAEASASLQDVVVVAVASGSLSLLIGTLLCWNIVKQSHCFPFLVTSWLSSIVAESHTCMLKSLKWKLFPVIVVIVEEQHVVFSFLWFLIQQMEFTVLD